MCMCIYFKRKGICIPIYILNFQEINKIYAIYICICVCMCVCTHISYQSDGF